MLMQLPPSYDHVITDPATGAPKVVRFQSGPLMEPDPDRPGYARLKPLSRGSPLRFGLSYVVASYTANPLTIAGAGVSGDLFIIPQEPGYLGKLVIVGLPVTASVFVTDVSRNGDRFFSGGTPAQMFDPLSRVSPWFGHYIDTTSRLSFNIQNTGGAAVALGIGFALL